MTGGATGQNYLSLSWRLDWAHFLRRSQMTTQQIYIFFAFGATGALCFELPKTCFVDGSNDQLTRPPQWGPSVTGDFR
jgi:hypothetical protein